MSNGRDLGFCPGCGGDIDANASFCRHCGRGLQQSDVRRAAPARRNRSRTAFFILVLVGVFLLWMGVETLLDPQPVIDEVMLQLDEFGFDAAFAEQFVLFYAWALVATATLSLIGGALALARKHWIIAIVCALLVTLTTPVFLFSLPAVFAIYFLWKGRDEFA